MSVADDRTYIRVHDGMDDHPKVVGLSDGAFRLLMRSWSYCSRQLTDGRLPDAAWRDRGTARARRELVDAGLAHLPGGECPHPGCPTPPPKHVQMHDYLEHQRSAAEVAALKRARAEAGRKGGKSRASAQASAKQVLEQTASKTVASTETEADTELRTSLRGDLT
jgi:general stress protein YciG